MRMVIEVSGLTKRYNGANAVDGVSFTVDKGEVFGIVGRNGAGKTTTVECLAGLRRPDAGTLRVLGGNPMDPQIRSRTGVQLQQAALPDRMRVGEAMTMYAVAYGRREPWRPLLQEWGLGGKEKASFSSLSGGQKQRLFVALALLNDPELVFLDEITTGLDPEARRETWGLIRRLRSLGRTVVLVSHDMAEVAALCDRVAVFVAGRVVALDTPANLSADHKDLEEAYFELVKNAWES
jgi:ABC-2 type transport system ATP-binding protein